jgi:hypothetical protein
MKLENLNSIKRSPDVPIADMMIEVASISPFFWLVIPDHLIGYRKDSPYTDMIIDQDDPI